MALVGVKKTPKPFAAVRDKFIYGNSAKALFGVASRASA